MPSFFPTALDIGLTAFALLVAAPCTLLLVESIAAILPLRYRTPASSSPAARHRLAVVIPAHNEELTLAATLAALTPQLLPGDRAILVADNCTDSTASIGRQPGIEVVQRLDADRRGKGYALAAGLDALRSDPPKLVIFLDADVPPPPGLLNALAAQVASTQGPVQAPYVLESPADSGPRSVISNFAFIVKNLARPTGLQRLGIPITLTGTGMAFPWELLQLVPLANGHLVEDMKLGVDLALAGHYTTLCIDITIRGELPSRQDVAMQQRTRWEHGHLSIIRAYALPLLWQAVKTGRLKLLLLALDLSIPPLALLTLLWIASICLALLTWIAFAKSLALVISALAGICLCSSVLIAWRRFAKHVSVSSFASIPLYVLWKIPLYFQFLIKKESTWVRTDRGPKTPSA